MKRLNLVIAGVAVTALLAGAAISGSHADPVTERQNIMKTYGASMGVLGGMAKGKMAYDAAKASEAAAALLAAASSDQSGFWVEGTQQGFADTSRAKISVWDMADDFAAKERGLIDAATAMNAAAGESLAALQGAIGGVGGACAACHKAHRGPKN